MDYKPIACCEFLDVPGSSPDVASRRSLLVVNRYGNSHSSMAPIGNSDQLRLRQLVQAANKAHRAGSVINMLRRSETGASGSMAVCGGPGTAFHHPTPSQFEQLDQVQADNVAHPFDEKRITGGLNVSWRCGCKQSARQIRLTTVCDHIHGSAMVRLLRGRSHRRSTDSSVLA